MKVSTAFAAAIALLFCAQGALAQRVTIDLSPGGDTRDRIDYYPPHIIMPQVVRPIAFVPPSTGTVSELTGVDAAVRIDNQLATTTLDIHLRNPNAGIIEAEVILPVPDGAVVRGFTFEGPGKEPTAELLTREEARRVYNEIVSKTRDPALLEFFGCSLVRSSVFPVPANGTQTIRLTYENLLTTDGGRVDYVLPRSESVDYTVPWTITVEVASDKPISTVYSPSHDIASERKGDNRIAVSLTSEGKRQPGPFRLSYLMQEDGISASLLAYPDPRIGGGYFLLLAGLPPKPVSGHAPIKREVTLVFDRSGSMNGEKIEQVRAAANQVIGGLEDGERFNLLVYESQVDRFAEAPVPISSESEKQAREYLDSVKARGGTNIYDALVESLRQAPAPDTLPIVLFLTDGLPTIGQTSEKVIRELAVKGNPYNRRLFTFGVGVDVNTPLLEKLAWDSRGSTTFVLPNEDVEVKVAQVFNRLLGPVLSDPALKVLDGSGAAAPRRVHDAMPAKLPDLFEGDQLVVLGQYVGDEPLHFRLTGNFLGEEKQFEYSFGLERASTANAFVARLWASRKIGMLIDAVRELGGNGDPTAAHTTASDPRMKELVDEIVRLSTEFGILTEYTSFLAREGSVLEAPEETAAAAEVLLQGRAVEVRSGLGSVNQDFNGAFMKKQSVLNISNRFYDAEMKEVQQFNCQQVGGKALYKKADRWVDSTVMSKPDVKPDKTVAFGSKEYFELAEKLAGRNQQAALIQTGEILLAVDDETILVEAPK